MIKALTYIALVIAILAGTALLYRNQPYSIVIERAGEVKKDQSSVVLQGPPPAVPFGPVSNVLSPMPMVAPPTTAPDVARPTPAPPPVASVKKRKPKKPRPAATSKLQSKWTAPEVKPFSLGDLFNVR